MALRLGYFLLVVLILNTTQVVHAKTIVFIHGYMAEGSIWSRSGVLDHLARNNWPFAGRYGYDAQGRVVYDVRKQGRDATVTVELPWEQSIEFQASLLDKYLSEIYKHRPQPIVLVGHSAGGVVARFSLVKNPVSSVHALITIATPHLGTPMADLGALASDSPLGIFLQELGDPTLVRSRGLFRDLQPARRGSMLYWLNRQKHPAIPYFSIIRSNEVVDITRYDQADLVVPPAYQDMNNVQALRGKSVSIASDGGHALSVYDAIRIQKILKQL